MIGVLFICAYLKRISNFFVIVVFSVPFGTFEIFHLRMQLADSADIFRVVPLALRHRLSPGLPHILICLAGVDGLLLKYLCLNKNPSLAAIATKVPSGLQLADILQSL